MKTELGKPWIPFARIEALVQFEPMALIFGLAVAALLVYKLFLKAVAEHRHRNLRSLFVNLATHMGILAALFGAYAGLRNFVDASTTVDRFSSYLGVLTILSGATVFVKTWRILVFEYLFLGHMKVGVPLLLVNLSTLILSVILGGWLLTEIFNVQLVPVLATSAIFSIILGLALQDTLGNLFAGVALQFDKPYEIGDWVEVQAGPQKWVGQVHEITWRATVLLGLSEETLVIPNRVIAGAEVSNYSTRTRPIIRSQVFRIPYGVPHRQVKDALLRAAASVPSLRRNPEPLVIMTEAAESWVSYKLVYFLDDYGSQWVIADQVISQALDSLQRAGIATAPPRLELVGTARA